MLTAVKAYNQRIDDDLAKISTTGDEVSAAVGVAIRSLQFEDVVTQVVGYSDSHVMRLNDLVHRLHSKNNRYTSVRAVNSDHSTATNDSTVSK